jgi:hypothetical protein
MKTAAGGMAMKQLATLLVGTSVAVLLAICHIAGTPAGRSASANGTDAGTMADARGLPDGHPSISGFMLLPEGHPPVLPEGHPPLPNLGNRCPHSSVNPWTQPGDAVRVPREAPDSFAI